MPETRYQIGQYVKVYFDPLTEQHFEGDGKLIQHVNEIGLYEGRIVHMWKVRFRGESSIYSRMVKEPNENISPMASDPGA